MTNRHYIVYGLIDPEDEIIKYIGKSRNGIQRAQKHTLPHYLQDDTKKIRWIKELLKKGLKPKVVILEEHSSDKQIVEAEIRLIRQFKSSGIPLTNMTKGGEGGITSDPKLRWKPIIAVNKKLGTTTYYPSGVHTEEDGFSRSKVAAVCKGRRYSHKGYYFYYVGQEQKIPLYKTKKRIRAITKKDGTVREFESIKDASKVLEISRETISLTINGHSKSRKYFLSVVDGCGIPKKTTKKNKQ